MSDYIYEKNARIVINSAYKFIIIVELIMIILLSFYSFKLTGKINEVAVDDVVSMITGAIYARGANTEPAVEKEMN